MTWRIRIWYLNHCGVTGERADAVELELRLIAALKLVLAELRQRREQPRQHARVRERHDQLRPPGVREGERGGGGGRGFLS